MSNEVLKDLAASEGYCCIRGYLTECAAEGKTPAEMAKYMGVARSTINYNYERMREDCRSHRCPGAPICYLKSRPQSSDE